MFAVPVGKWPPGMVGTLVESYEDGGIVEVSGDESEGIDLVAVPYGALLRRDRDLAASAERAGEPGEDRQIRM